MEVIPLHGPQVTLDLNADARAPEVADVVRDRVERRGRARVAGRRPVPVLTNTRPISASVASRPSEAMGPPGW